MSQPKPPLPNLLRLPALTLAAHALEYQRPSGIMSDPSAHAWHAQLKRRYDNVPVPDAELVNGIVTRSIIIDYAVLEFWEYRRCVVIDLGAGFSTRRKRLNLKLQPWVHIDLPQVLEVRRWLQPPNENEWFIALDLCDLQDDCLHLSLDFFDDLTQNYLFIAEGLLNHLPRACAEALIRQLRARYPEASIIGTLIYETALEGAKALASQHGFSITNMWTIPSDRLPDMVGEVRRTWLLGKVASNLGLIRPTNGDQASGIVFMATL